MSTDRINRLTRRRWLGLTGMAVLCLAWLGGCSSDSDSDTLDPPILTPSAFLVSDPVSSPAPAGAGANVTGSRGAATLAYVSLAEGELPTGVSATIQNWRTRATITTPMVAGGFDPVAVEAAAGDTLEIEIEVSSGPGPLSFLLRVPLAAPPIVVRTEPVDGKRDVPLNARIIIVFSEPIDESTLTGTTIRLKRGFTLVAGAVQVANMERLTAEFVPAEPLAPGTGYQLEVSQGIEDLDGEALAAPAVVAFTTGTASAMHLVFTVQPSAVMQDSAISPAVKVGVQDALGNAVPTFTDSISVALGQNPGGALLAGTTTVAAVGGVATFTHLQLSAGGIGYTLSASAAGVTGATSSAFLVAFDNSLAVGRYERTTPNYLPGDHTRYLLAADGTFELQYETVARGNFAYTGRYWVSGASINFDFDGWSVAGAWEASGTLLGDSLVVGYNIVMQLSDFEDGVYARSEGTEPPLTVGGRIAFASNRDGSYHIHVANPDGSNLTRLAEGVQPAWSWDGSRIAFVRPTNGGGPQGVYVMEADGSNQTWLGDGWTPSWSPDGSQIVFSQDTAIMVMRADGSDRRELINVTFPGIAAGSTRLWRPAWSPDGLSIAFDSRGGGTDAVVLGGRQVYVMDANGSNLRRLSQDGWSKFNPAWSPDGLRVVVQSYDTTLDGAGGYDQVIASYDASSGGRELPYRSGMQWLLESPDISPDGRYLAFSQLVYFAPGFKYRILLLRPETGRLRAFLPAAANPVNPEYADSDPVWSRN